MNGIDQLLQLLEQHWGQRTLNDLKADAENALNGTAFESIREATGRRVFILLCATGEFEIQKIENTFDLAGQGLPVDWDEKLLSDFVADTVKGEGISFEDLREVGGTRVAITICATSPEMIAILERSFQFPN